LASVLKKIYNSIDKDLNLPMNMFSRFMVLCCFWHSLVFLFWLRCQVEARLGSTTLLPHSKGIKNGKRSRVVSVFIGYNATIKSRFMAYSTFTPRIASVSSLLRPFWGLGQGLIFMAFDGSFTRNDNDLIIDFECHRQSPLISFYVSTFTDPLVLFA